MSIYLDAHTVLKNARKAYEEGCLQFQQEAPDGFCSYAGPCAIGVSLDKNIAVILDEIEDLEDDKLFNLFRIRRSEDAEWPTASIGSLLENGIVTTNNSLVLIKLQERHDYLVGVANWSLADKNAKFKKDLDEIEEMLDTAAEAC